MEKNENDNGSRRKLLVPLIAIMLCTVAVVGAGYAYASQLTLNDNNLNPAKLSVTLDAEAKPVFTHADDSVDLVFVQDITLNDPGGDGTYDAPVTDTTANGVTTDATSNLGTLNVDYVNETGKDAYAMVSVKISSGTAGGVALDKFISGVTINGVEFNYSEISAGTFTFKNVNGSGAKQTESTGSYDVVLKVDNTAFGGADDIDAFIRALENIDFALCVKLSSTEA